MEKIQVTDEWLYRYMPVAAEALLEDIEKEIDYKYEFTVGIDTARHARAWRENHPDIITLEDYGKLMRGDQREG